MPGRHYNNGWYSGTVTNIGVITRGTAKLYAIEAAFSESTPEYGGDVLSWTGSTESDSAKDRVIKALITCGYKTSADAPKKPSEQRSNIVGTKVRFLVEMNDRGYGEIKGFGPDTGGQRQSQIEKNSVSAEEEDDIVSGLLNYAVETGKVEPGQKPATRTQQRPQQTQQARPQGGQQNQQGSQQRPAQGGTQSRPAQNNRQGNAAPPQRNAAPQNNRNAAPPQRSMDDQGDGYEGEQQGDDDIPF